MDNAGQQGVMTRVADMAADELLALVTTRAINEREALEILRNPYCSSEVAVAVAEQRQALTSHKVREILAGFRGFPLTRAMSFIVTLPWTSVLELAKEPRTPPVVRRQAERKILEKLTRMTLGEKVALARKAHRPLFRALMNCADEAVLVALLDNSRLVENDVLVILNTVDAPPPFYRALAAHNRWGNYYPVRKAMAGCGRIPVPIALSMLVQLNSNDLRQIVDGANLDSTVREAAKALLEKRKRPRRAVIR